MTTRRLALPLALALLAAPLGVLAAHHEQGSQGHGMMKRGMGHKGMHHGMHGGMMGMCPMATPGASFQVENVENGIRITVTSPDAKLVRRLQKRAEIMRLVHELHEEELQDR